MYHTTGLEKAEILDLCEMMIHRDATVDERTWPPILGLYKSVVVTLTSRVSQFSGAVAGRGPWGHAGDAWFVDLRR